MNEVTQDQLAIIRIEGMHCHRCEDAIRRLISAEAGVHEVEIDFRSGQASILYDASQIDIPKFIDLIREAGYRPGSYTRGGAP